MKAAKVYEKLEFDRGNPKKAMGIGNVYLNRDFNTVFKNFKSAFPEAKNSYQSTSTLHAPGGPHPAWKIISVPIENRYENLEERKKKYEDWFNQNTDYDIVEIEASQREYHPWGDENLPKQYTQSFSIKFRNHEDVK